MAAALLNVLRSELLRALGAAGTEALASDFAADRAALKHTSVAVDPRRCGSNPQRMADSVARLVRRQMDLVGAGHCSWCLSVRQAPHLREGLAPLLHLELNAYL